MSKSKVAVSFFVVVLLFAAVLVYFDTRLIKRTQQTAQESMNTQTSAESDGMVIQTEGSKSANNQEKTTADSSETAIEDMESKAVIKSETVIVKGNTPEYGLELKLYENNEGRTFLRLQYYLNGIGHSNELDEGELPELAGIFGNREKEQGNAEAFRVRQAILNPVHSQLYLLIQDAPLGIYNQSAFYLIELNDMSIKKLFSYPGLYGEIACNKDYSLLAYSFGDPPHLSNLQEDNLVNVFDCKNGEYIIKNNRNMSGNVLGKNSSPDYLYDYEFEAWQSASILRMRQAARPKNDLDSGLIQTEVLYDIEKNLLLLTDGSEQKTAPSEETEIISAADIKGSQSNNSKDEEKNIETESSINTDVDEITDSEPVKVLQSFYSYLSKGDEYTNAMQLLDDSFQLKLDMLKQFGADVISKGDISIDSASVYSELLKAAKLDTITKAEIKDSICTVSYYQILELSTDSQVRQSMSAQLKKTEEAWKIILIEDGIQ